MDRKFSSALLLIALSFAYIGCNSATEPAAMVGSPSQPTTASASGDAIAQTVQLFLDAIRSGDTQGSSSRLTPLALRMINENDMTFAPPASENASFEVGQVQMYGQDRASVESVWSDLDADGQRTNEKMTWALKLQQGEWRISGLIAYMGEAQSPVKINFENPSEFMGGNPGPRTANQATPPQSPPGSADSPRQASQPTRDPFR